MKIKEISVTYGGKLNLGDYNSAHVEMTACALLEPGDDGNEAVAQLWQTVQESVRTQVRVLAARRSARVDEVFMGLPVDTRAQIGGK